MHTLSSKRWCPTPEQVMILEELYTRGLRTPNAAQIQKITAHLAIHGKIQGKNVFYWFQNHKARDRQKMRRKIEKQRNQNHVISELEVLPSPPPPFFKEIRPPSVAVHFPYSHYNPPENVLSQGERIYDEGQEGVSMSSQTWPSMISYGPIFPCCNRNRPIRTLQLFPIRSDEEIEKPIS